MNRVWEIRERRGSEERGGMHEDVRASRMSRRMSSYKDKESYEMGFKEGYCAALDEIDEFLDEHTK